jgi:hypothetical protein
MKAHLTGRGGAQVGGKQVMPPACLEAEEFAQNLLMPKTMVLEHCILLAEAEIPRREWGIWIGKLFGVPRDKATGRLRELELL